MAFGLWFEALDFGVPLFATSSARALVVATITFDIFVTAVGCGWDKAAVGVWNRETVGDFVCVSFACSINIEV